MMKRKMMPPSFKVWFLKIFCNQLIFKKKILTDTTMFNISFSVLNELRLDWKFLGILPGCQWLKLTHRATFFASFSRVQTQLCKKWHEGDNKKLVPWACFLALSSNPNFGSGLDTKHKTPLRVLGQFWSMRSLSFECSMCYKSIKTRFRQLPLKLDTSHISSYFKMIFL